MDLKDYSADQVGTVHLYDPSERERLLYADDEKTKPVRIFIHGPESKEYIAASDAQLARRLSRTKQVSPAQERADLIQWMSEITKGWENIQFNGEQLEFNQPNARMVYEAAWIRRQIDEALINHGNFTKTASNNSGIA